MEQSIQYIKELLRSIGEYKLENIKQEILNKDYEAFSFQIEKHTFRSRLAKLTPKKKGYFVVFWEKDENGKNKPYSFYESPNKIIVSIMDDEKSGQFIFPKKVLLEKGILLSPTQKGKMAIRVYPSWETGLNATAKRTQKWQQDYFVDTTNAIDIERLKDLYFSY